MIYMIRFQIHSKIPQRASGCFFHHISCGPQHDGKFVYRCQQDSSYEA